jgi:hypothetical protein
MKFVDKIELFKRYVGYFLLGVILTTQLYWFSFYDPKDKVGEKFIIFDSFFIFIFY